MQYIKKIGIDLEARGTASSQQYIDGCWNKDEGCYVNLVYDASKMGELRRILVEEDAHCCYCMRKLYIDDEGMHKRNVTLEHIIPHQIKEQEWEATKENYLKFEPLSSDKVKVCYEGKYDNPAEQITDLPHPHYVSYHNLVASCNGQTACCHGEDYKEISHNCCNNKRQERFVMPIFYDEKVEELFGYGKDGKLVYDDECFEEKWFDKDHLNLISDWLTSVRRFWYELSHSEYSVEDVEKAITDEDLRTEIMDEIDPQARIFAAGLPDRLWIIISEYSWFYHYYRTNASPK